MRCMLSGRLWVGCKNVERFELEAGILHLTGAPSCSFTLGLPSLEVLPEARSLSCNEDRLLIGRGSMKSGNDV